ncbi:MAG: FAD binding domain-containing protein [Pyrinomonadaceae bacterium]
MKFILNEETISTDLPTGSTVLDFVRYHKNLKGTKIGCREGDCGACTILVGELVDDKVGYRTMTSCLMPLANAAGKHVVTIEGINPADGSLTPVQQAMVDESGTQCGFCTVGFVMSLTGFTLGTPAPSPALVDQAISSIDGNICRCTGYKSIERAACKVSEQVTVDSEQFVPKVFAGISDRLRRINSEIPQSAIRNPQSYVGGGTDVYVQKPDAMAETVTTPLFYDNELRGIRDAGEFIEIGASATVTDLLESDLMNAAFPDLYKHLKLVSSTPIRNMATLAGNFVNASPIGDMTVWFLALDAEITLSSPPYEGGLDAASVDGVVLSRAMTLRDLYLGYKQLAKQPDEIITNIRFKRPTGDFRFNFEKVCKRTFLDIATVNTAISLTCSPPYEGGVAEGRGGSLARIEDAHIAAGGVAPIPLYLKQTSEFLRGKEITEETIVAANEIIQSEISPISDVRGTEEYKRLLLRQLFRAHFVELFEE